MLCSRWCTWFLIELVAGGQKEACERDLRGRSNGEQDRGHSGGDGITPVEGSQDLRQLQLHREGAAQIKEAATRNLVYKSSH